MYEVLNKDMMKSEILTHLFVTKRGWDSKCDLAEVIPYISLQVGKLAVNGKQLLLFLDAASVGQELHPCNRHVGGSKRMCFPCHFPLRVV